MNTTQNYAQQRYDAVKTKRVGFLSKDGKSQIRALIWEPPANPGATPRGIVQLVHGMAEHIERYDAFARHLASRGYVVCGHDHIGHGASANPADYGCMPPDGKEALIEDVHELRQTVASRYSRRTPYIIFGHSMGSFVTRCYLARHGEGLSGAILCGTAQQPAALSASGRTLARALVALKGADAKSPLLDSLVTGSFSKAIENARTPFDWLSTDPDVVDAYIADEACGFPFSAGGYVSLLSLICEMTSSSAAHAVPPELPLLFVAGSADPVGENGEAVQRAATQYRTAGCRYVEVRLYDGMRHEILNECERETVYADLDAWIDEKTSR